MDFSAWDKMPVVFEEGPPRKERSIRIPKTPRPLVEIPDAPRFLQIPGGPNMMPKAAKEIRFREKAIDMSGLSTENDENDESPMYESVEVSAEVVMKIGGAAITDKHSLETLRPQVLSAIAGHISDLRSALSERSGVVIVHGAGSFGHHFASRYSIHRGLLFHPNAILGFSKTRLSVTKLNNHVLEALVARDIPAVGVSPSSFLRTHDTKCSDVGFVRLCQHIKTLLSMGLVPVVHGDAVIDTVVGSSILSGDTIARALVRSFRPKRCVFSTDQDGVFDRHPDVDGAKIVRNLVVDDTGAIDASISFDPPLSDAKEQTNKPPDVTGQMRTKLKTASSCALRGSRVFIVRGGSPAERCSLLGEDTSNIDCTTIVRKYVD